MRSTQEEDARKLEFQLLVLVIHREVAVVLVLMFERAIDRLCHDIIIPRGAEASLAECYLPIYWHTEMGLAAYDVALVCVVPCSYGKAYGEKL